MRHPSDRPDPKRPDQSFPKKDRLLQRAEYLAVTRRGRRFSTRNFLLFIRPNREGRPRLGIVVSRKVGKAVQRNHVKRRVREFFRLHKSWFPHSADTVVVGKKGIPPLSYAEVCDDLGRFLRKAPFPPRKGQPRAGEGFAPNPHRDSETL